MRRGAVGVREKVHGWEEGGNVRSTIASQSGSVERLMCMKNHLATGEVRYRATCATYRGLR